MANTNLAPHTHQNAHPPNQASEHETCPICYLEFPSSEMVTLPCNHKFSQACIIKWTQR
ncbi:uncharacterized protein F4822DRAFT_395912 [Hypoxylon trugodes]|uniref:uncharacterized protein n=1 Tax=Hypoxylon trugodes TaxID=326681 RepID=UPI0021920058|nr:uncharacterized protein F4822DRAFT_395912 [Hypoxylon trugodes]KAI1391198.1 hypothetical protein F4822DRAFT_395912 [Hypoxylon trugodes]